MGLLEVGGAAPRAAPHVASTGSLLPQRDRSMDLSVRAAGLTAREGECGDRRPAACERAVPAGDQDRPGMGVTVTLELGLALPADTESSDALAEVDADEA